MQRLRSMLRSLFTHPRRGVVVAVLLAASALLVPHITHAGTIGDAVVQVLNWILSAIVYILGVLLVRFIDVLIWVFQFNNFINAPAVQTGWTVTRDVANMFFIVALLVIAIGTVLRIEEYRYSRLLQKLIIMAILINFSKLIAGFFIDLSQVVMLTFVNAFKDMAAGNLTTGFGLQKIVALSQTASAAGGDVNYWSIMGAMFAAVVMLFVALVVVGIFVVVLIQRIIMLWIYIVLAPTAYMVAVLPGSLGSWWSSWWRDFSSYLIKGPIIAFFMWLSLTIISLTNNVLFVDTSQTAPQDSTSNLSTTGQGTDLSAFASEATTSQAIISYILAIGMLIAGLQQAMKSGGAGGALAGKMLGNFNRWGGKAVGGVVGAATFVPARLARDLGGGAVKRVAYPVADALMAFGSKVPLMKGYWGMQRGKFRNYRDTKDRTALERTDFNSLMAMQGVMPTEAGRANRAEAASVIVTKQGKKYAKLSMDDKTRVWKNFAANAGFKVKYDEKSGRVAEEYESARGRGVFNEAVSKNPAMWSVMLNQLDEQKQSISQAEYDAKRTWMLKKARQQANKMTTTGLNEMSTDFLTAEPGENGSPARARFNEDLPVRKAFTEEMAQRLLTNQNFRRNYNANVVKDQQEDIWKSYQHLRDTGNWGLAEGFPAPSGTAMGTVSGDEDLDAETFAQEDIDRQRQQRTEALQKQYGDTFEQSAEYLADPDQYYSQQQFEQNANQQKRVLDRIAAGKAGVSEITSLNKFSRGDSNTLAVSEAMLNQAGAKATAGGYIRNPAAVKRIAGALNNQLAGDVQAIEGELSSLAQEEQQLNRPTGNLVDASGRPMTAAQVNPEKLQDIAARRTALLARQATLQATQARLKDPSALGDLTFINADRSGGSARNILAEEAMHKKLATMDTDGSIHASMQAQFTPDEFQAIVEDMRKRSDNPEMSEARAFDEYLAKGLVNQGRWADKAPDAVKLKAGMALALKAKAEEKHVDLKLTAADEAAMEEVVVPPPAGIGRKLRADAGEMVGRVTGFVTAPLQRRREAEKAAEAKRTQILQSQPVLDVSVKRDAFQSAQQELAKAEQEYADLRKQKDAKLKGLQGEYSRNEATYNDRTKSRAERDNAYDLMGVYRNEIAKESKELEAKQVQRDKARTVATERQGALRTALTTKAEAKNSTTAAKTTPSSTSAAAVSGKQSREISQSGVEDVDETRATVNVVQNIRNVYNAAPPEIRAKLSGINADTLDSALKNSIVWRGLMSYIKNNARELEKSEKLGALGQKELQKRMGTMEKHMNDGNAEAFKEEFNSFQGVLNGSGSEEN